MHFVETGEKPEGIEDEHVSGDDIHSDLDFDDLGDPGRDSIIEKGFISGIKSRFHLTDLLFPYQINTLHWLINYHNYNRPAAEFNRIFGPFEVKKINMGKVIALANQKEE